MVLMHLKLIKDLNYMNIIKENWEENLLIMKIEYQ